jgi:nucleotide-binding universal stress UspA family protein
VPPDWEDLGRSIVNDAAALARVAAPAVAVHTRLMHGATVRALVAAAGDADLIVLGAQHEGNLVHVWTGRVSTAVAARATCPTVVVPPEWKPDALHRRVVVGFKEPDGSACLLRAAFTEAESRGADLVIVHAWKLPAAYDDVIGARVAQETYRDHAREIIEPLIADLRAAHPGVRVIVAVPHAQAARALIDASYDADLLVMSCPSAHQGIRHLGSTARAVIRWSTCPVIVYPATSSGELVDDTEDEVPFVLERDGALQR